VKHGRQFSITQYIWVIRTSWYDRTQQFIHYTGCITQSAHRLLSTRHHRCCIFTQSLLRQKNFNSLNKWVQFVGFQKQHTPVWAHLHIILHPVSDQARVGVTFHAELKLIVCFLYTQTYKLSSCWVIHRYTWWIYEIIFYTLMLMVAQWLRRNAAKSEGRGFEPRWGEWCKIWGFHGSDYEERRLLWCYAVWLLYFFVACIRC
jgi:hypothetical protein